MRQHSRRADRPLPGAMQWRSSYSRAMASCFARRLMRKDSPVGSPRCTTSSRRWRRVGEGERCEMLMLAATDPANPYGALLRWPAGGDAASSLTRSVGARVVLCDGALAAYLRRGNPNVQVFLPEEEPERGRVAQALAEFLVAHVRGDRENDPAGRAGLLIATGRWG